MNINSNYKRRQVNTSAPSHQIPIFQPQTSDFRLPTPNIRYLTSDSGHRSPNFKNLMLFVLMVALASCSPNSPSNSQNEHGHDHGHDHGHGHSDVVRLSQTQFDVLGLKVDTASMRSLSNYVKATGQLEVPPQSEAAVTAIIGANVMSIKVIEGDKVRKGQVLAILSHPDLIRLQTDYLSAWSELQYLEKEQARQKELYEQKATSGRDYQKLNAEYLTMKGKASGAAAQLKLLGLNLNKIKEGEIYELVPLITPIDGFVRKVKTKIGQYVSAQTELFEIVNIDHIHADLMVFEKDMYKVKAGQKVLFTIESLPDQELEATIYSVGKAFEENPKAIHLHAEIEEKEGLLLPGTYVKGRILIDENTTLAIPEEGVVKQGDKNYVFSAGSHSHGDKTEWTFTPHEVMVGKIDGGWVEITLIKKLKPGTRFASNNAFHLMAELKKEEAEHSH